MADELGGPVDERIPELAYVWRELSEMVQQARSTPIPPPPTTSSSTSSRATGTVPWPR
jgi:hypothetical protein